MSSEELTRHHSLRFVASKLTIPAFTYCRLEGPYPLLIGWRPGRQGVPRALPTCDQSAGWMGCLKGTSYVLRHKKYTIFFVFGFILHFPFDASIHLARF